MKLAEDRGLDPVVPFRYDDRLHSQAHPLDFLTSAGPCCLTLATLTCVPSVTDVTTVPEISSYGMRRDDLG